MTWHILGAGSLGCLWASRLLLAGEDVRLILRPSRLAQFQSAGSCLRFTDLQQNSHFLPVSAETAANAEPVHRLILACKAYSAADAATGIRHRLDKNSQVILLQNGIGSQQEVSSLLPMADILAASSTEGAWLASDFHCTHAGQGQTLFGRLNASSAPPPDWLALLNRCGIPVQWQPDIGHVLWRKLAINCLINPLTVIYRCRNGELNRHLPLIEQLAGELSQLLVAAGHPLAARDLFATTCQIINATAANTSSMLQDVQQGRRTEISYMTGFALQQCLAFGVAHQQLLSLHRTLQEHLARQNLPIN